MFKKIVIVALLMSGGFILADAKIKFVAQKEGEGRLKEVVEIKLWEGDKSRLRTSIFRDMRRRKIASGEPFKTLELQPGDKKEVTLPAGSSYLMKMFGKNGEESDLRVVITQASGMTDTLLIEQYEKKGFFGKKTGATGFRVAGHVSSISE